MFVVFFVNIKGDGKRSFVIDFVSYAVRVIRRRRRKLRKCQLQWFLLF